MRFSDVVETIERPVVLHAGERYRLLTAKRSRGGIELRSELPGGEILTKSQYAVRSGDFVISRRQIIHGACGVVPPALDGAIVSNEYSVLRTRSPMLMEFLRWYSHTSYFQRTCFHSSHGVDVEKMIFKIDEWLERPVDVPPLPEQQKIAAILSSVDEAIEATDAVIAQLQAVKKAMMADLLTKGLPGRHTTFQNTPIGVIPADWTVRPVCEFGRVVTGSTPSPSVGEYWGGEFPFITPGDLADSPTVDTTARSVTQEGLARSRELPPGTVLVTCIGASIGKAGVVDRRSCSNQQINSVVCVDEVSPLFVFYALLGSRSAIIANAAATAVPIINKKTFENILLPCPNRAEQDEIGFALRSIDARIQVERDYVSGLRGAKGALTSILLSGDLRVRPDASSEVAA